MAATKTENGSSRALAPSDPRALLLTADEVAERLRVTKCWIYAEVRAGRLPHVRLGRYVRFRAGAIDSWIERIERGGQETNGAVEAEVAPSAGSMRTWIAARDLKRVRRAIEALSERGRRFGTGPIALRELERRDKEVLVELSGEPPRPAGWEVVGRLDHREGGPGRIGFATRDLDRAAWSGAGPWCEHCGVLRRRTVTYLVRTGGGEIRQIGSSCLREFTGHDLARVLRQAELIREGRAAVRRSARNSTPSAGLDLIDDEWREAGFLGPVGARVEAQVEVQALRVVGRNRFGDVVWHGMRDERDRWVSWFASGGRRLRRGGRYRLRGRVRRHGEWRGRPVTVLSRCTAEPI